MAYADDVTLFFSSEKSMSRMLETVSEFLERVGMGLSVGKCVEFMVERRGDAWVSLPVYVSVRGRRSVPTAFMNL